MKSVTYRRFYQSILAGVCILSLAGSAGAQSEASEHEAGRLEGSWTVKVTQHNCQTGGPVGDPFFSLLTFSRGGLCWSRRPTRCSFPLFAGTAMACGAPRITKRTERFPPPSLPRMASW